jgi:hypothetical protein
MKHQYARIWMALACAIALAAGAPASAEVNLLANPGFEDLGGSYDGWFTFGGGVQLSLPGGDNIIRTGAAASKIYGGYPTCPGLPQFNVGGYGQAFTPTAGQVYELRGFSFVSSGDPIPGTNTCTGNRLLAKIAFFDAASGGNEIASNEIVIGDHTSPLDEWIPFTVTAPAPATALRVEALFLYLQPACDDGAVFVDDASFVEATPNSPAGNLLVNPSFDTNLNGWSIFGNAYYDGRAFARRTPTGAAKLFSTFVGGSDSGMFQQFPATPGTDWQLDAYVMTTCMETPLTGTNANALVGSIVFRDAGNVEIGSATGVLLDNTAPLGTWTKRTVIVNDAPAGTATVEAYILFVSPALEGGAAWVDDVYFGVPVATGVGDTPAPLAFQLHQNVPNPFSPNTRIDFDLTGSVDVNVSVYDVRGRRIATLVQGRLGSGPHSVMWDGKSESGVVAASGIYWCVLKTPAGHTTKKMVLLR